MKKLLCIAIVLAMVLTTLFVMPASAANDTLTITAEGKVVGTVKVGGEFIYRIGLYAGEKKILNGQAHLDYDSSYISFVPHTASYVDSDGDVVTSIDAYSFPAKIRNASLVLNTEHPGQINYNFTKSDGIAALSDSSKLFARFRFTAKKAGTTDITNTIAYMIDVNEQQIYYKEQASTTVKPYQTVTVEEPISLVGDVNGDNKITILDATVIQRAAVGIETAYTTLENADTSGDGKVSLRDVMYVKQYLANLSSSGHVGEWLYASEIG